MPPPLERNLGTAAIIRSNALCCGESEKIIVLLLICEIKKSQPFLFKTIGSDGNKKRQVVLVTICRPCSVFSCYLGSYLSSKGKSRFSIHYIPLYHFVRNHKNIKTPLPQGAEVKVLQEYKKEPNTLDAINHLANTEIFVPCVIIILIFRLFVK